MVSFSSPNGTDKIQYYDNWVLGALIVSLSLLFSLLGFVEYGTTYQLSIEVIAVNLLYTLAGVITLRGIVYAFDQFYPWSRSVSKRFIGQLVLTLIIYLIIQTFIIYSLETDNLKGPENQFTIISTYFIGTIMVFLINALYLLFYIQHRNKEKKQDESSKSYLFVRRRSKRVNILSTDLNHIFIEDTLVKGYDNEGATVVLSDNLTELEKVLDTDVFYRANRQNLIQKKSIKSVTFNDNKSCTILSISGKEIIVSRHKAPSFKRWFKR